MDVTVIIPTYNRLWSLPKAIESCRSNTCDTEIIVVDDGSTDGTWEWLQTQSELILIRQENWGKPWAVNRALEVATGDYVRFLDSDDWLEPNANDRQWAIAMAENSDVVVAGYQAYSESEELLEQHPWVVCDDFIAQQLGECESSHYSAYLFRRDFLQLIPHRPDFALRDDRLFVLEVAMAKPTIAVCEDLTLAHRHHHQPRLQSSVGIRSVVTHWQQLMLYQKCLARLDFMEELTQRRREAAAKILWPLAHWLAYTHPQEAQAVADWVYQLHPTFAPPERGGLGVLYRTVGFRRTEQLLKLRRSILQMLRPKPPQVFFKFSSEG